MPGYVYWKVGLPLQQDCMMAVLLLLQRGTAQKWPVMPRGNTMDSGEEGVVVFVVKLVVWSDMVAACRIFQILYIVF